MSLIKCPGCGHEVSSKATECPECGASIVGNIKRCPVCNALSFMDAEQCSNCGTHFVVEKKVAEDAGQTKKSKNADNSDLPTDDSPTPSKKRSCVGRILLLLLIAAAAGSYFYYQHLQQAHQEEQAYQLLMQCTEREIFQSFLSRYPDSPHAEHVRARLAELKNIDDKWAALCAHPQQNALRQFIHDNPSTIHKAAALHIIDSLDWREADSVGTSASYATYISKHENGENITQAFEARTRAIHRENKARHDSIAAAGISSDSNSPVGTSPQRSAQ